MKLSYILIRLNGESEYMENVHFINTVRERSTIIVKMSLVQHYQALVVL